MERHCRMTLLSKVVPGIIHNSLIIGQVAARSTCSCNKFGTTGATGVVRRFEIPMKCWRSICILRFHRRIIVGFPFTRMTSMSGVWMMVFFAVMLSIRRTTTAYTIITRFQHQLQPTTTTIRNSQQLAWGHSSPTRRRNQQQQQQRWSTSSSSSSSSSCTTTCTSKAATIQEDEEQIVQEEEQQPEQDDKEDTTTKPILNWERFDFSVSPKYDARFQTESLLSIDKSSSVLSKEEELDLLYQNDRILDAQFRQTLQRSQWEWANIDPQVLQTAIDTVEPFIRAERRTKIQTVFRQRTQNTRFLFENPANPSNVWACLRTLDAFGIQYVHVIMDPNCYDGKLAVTQKHGMRTAMGSAQWLTITHHESTPSAIQQLQSQGYTLYASDLGTMNTKNDDNEEDGKHPRSQDIRNIQFGKQEKICIVMGNEERGISDVMRQLCADHLFYLPMVGFAESFNVSVATAITLAHLSAKPYGPIRPGDLHPHDLQCLYLKGLIHSLPQKRMAKALLQKFHLPTEITGNW